MEPLSTAAISKLTMKIIRKMRFKNMAKIQLKANPSLLLENKKHLIAPKSQLLPFQQMKGT